VEVVRVTLVNSNTESRLIALSLSVCLSACIKDMVEVVRVTLVNSNTESRLVAGLESLIETTQDFTDSAYTSHDHRQQILMICEQLRHQLSVVVRIGASLVRNNRYYNCY